MTTVESILGPRPEETPTVESLLGPRPEQSKSGLDNTIAGINKGISFNPISVLVDITNSALGYVGLDSEKPIGGSESVVGLMEDLGISATPDKGSIGGMIGQEVGANVSSLGVLGVVGKARQAWGWFTPVIDFIKTRPLASLIGDVGISLPAGWGAEWGRRAGEEMGNEAAGEQIGRLAGTLAPAGLTAALSGLSRTGANVFKGVDKNLSISQAASKENAGDILRQSMSHPNSEDILLSGDIPYPKFGRPTTGQYLDDPGLMALERGVARTQGPTGIGRSQDVSMAQNQSLRQGLAPLGSDVGIDTKTGAVSFFRKRVNDTIVKVNNSIDRAIEKSQRRIDRLSVDEPIDRIQAIARDDLDAAMTSARNEETRVWGLVGNGRFRTGGVVARANNIIEDTPRLADPERVDDLIYEIAGRTRAGDDAPSILHNIETSQEISGLRSRVAKLIRQSNADGDYDRARNLRSIRDSLTNDLLPEREGGDVLERMAMAREFSIRFNDAFTRGPVGKILGFDESGGLRVAPELTMERLIVPGTKGILGVRALRESVSPGFFNDNAMAQEAMMRMNASMEDFLKAKFSSSVMRDGGFDFTKVSNFIRQYPALGEFPALRQQMMDAAGARQLAESVTNTTRQRVSRIESMSAASRYTQGEVPLQTKAILDAKNPLSSAKSLMNAARKDPTGEALKGVRGSFYELMMDRVAPDVRQSLDDVGDTFVNAKKLRAFVKEYTPVIREIYGDKGLAMMREVSRGADMRANLSKGFAAGGGSNTAEMMHVANRLRDAAGTIGVMIGTKIGRAIGGHTLLAAGMGRRQVNRIVESIHKSGANDVMALLEEALYDPDFARELLRPANMYNNQKATMNLMKFAAIKELMSQTPEAMESAAQAAP